MNVKFSKLRLVSLIMIVAGLLAFGIGYAVNHNKGEAYITEMMNHCPSLFGADESSHAGTAHDAGHEEHMTHLLNQLHNRPWSAVLLVTFMFTGISAAAMFFLSIQNVAQAGWSITVMRVMESISSFLPYASVMLFLVFLASYFKLNHIYHWMDENLTDVNSDKYDVFLDSKSYIWLDKNFWLARAALYLLLWNLLALKIKKLSARLDQTKQDADYWTLFKWCVIYIVVFAITSAAAAFDWIMSIDPHWYSTLFMWYNMVSYLVCAISIMLLLSVYLKSKGMLQTFNHHHQHDLAKYMFGFSMLWTYLWFDQFLLIWYANIPEESNYFWARYAMYKPTYFWMLIPNFILPFLAMISSDAKRVKTIVVPVAFIIILGHYWDFFNQIYPGSVGPFWELPGWYEAGSFLFMAGAFTFVVLRSLSVTKDLESKGHPMYHESKIFEYPF